MEEEDLLSSCKIENKLDEIHRWAHVCLDRLSKDDLHAAHAIGEKILQLLDEQPVCNGIKFIAIFEAIAVGADMLEKDMREMKHCAYIN